MTMGAQNAGDAGPAHMEDERPLSTSERLEHIVATAPGETITLGALLGDLRERAFGVFILVLALPCCIPFLYVIPQIVAVPLLFVTAQLVMGRSTPWLPERFQQREIRIAHLADLTRRAGRYLRFFERVSRPRLSFITRAPVDRLVGLFLLCFCVSILLPLPSTNTAPGIAVAIVALGFLERDGVLVTLGVILGALWIGFLIFAGATIVSFFLGGDDTTDLNGAPPADTVIEAPEAPTTADE